jgi:hypothetical protein
MYRTLRHPLSKLTSHHEQEWVLDTRVLDEFELRLTGTPNPTVRYYEARGSMPIGTRRWWGSDETLRVSHDDAKSGAYTQFHDRI